MSDNLLSLSTLYEKRGDVHRAFEYCKSTSILKDSIFTREKLAKFTDLQIQYNLEQQQQKNEILKMDNEIQEVIITTLKALLMPFLVFRIYYPNNMNI